MQFGFSYVGLIFLVMLMVPNLIWTKHQPKDYEKYVKNENKLLLALERIGEVLVSAAALVFADFNWKYWSAWSWWLIAAFALMLLYEFFWLRYFRSEKTMRDFYRSLLGIPVAGAAGDLWQESDPRRCRRDPGRRPHRHPLDAQKRNREMK